MSAAGALATATQAPGTSSRDYPFAPVSGGPGNVTQHSTDSLFQDQVVFSKFSWPAVLGGDEVFIWGEQRAGSSAAAPRQAGRPRSGSARRRKAAGRPGLQLAVGKPPKPLLVLTSRLAPPAHARAAGSFNDWAKGVKLHKISKEADAVVILPLQPGTYEVCAFVCMHGWTLRRACVCVCVYVCARARVRHSCAVHLHGGGAVVKRQSQAPCLGKGRVACSLPYLSRSMHATVNSRSVHAPGAHGQLCWPAPVTARVAVQICGRQGVDAGAA